MKYIKILVWSVFIIIGTILIQNSAFVDAEDNIKNNTGKLKFNVNKDDSLVQVNKWYIPHENILNIKHAQISGGLVADVTTHQILWQKNIDKPYPIASLTKLMVALITMEKVDKGEVSLNDTITISKNASKIGGSQVYLAEGERFTLEELLEAALIFSANDAAYQIGEYIGGNDKKFIKMMNEKAQKMGWNSMHFSNITGLPPTRHQKDNVSSALDLLELAEAVMKYPHILQITSTRLAYFRENAPFLLTTRNSLIKYDYIDGLKTGFYFKAGFCIVTTAYKDKHRLVSVILGAQNPKYRNKLSKYMIDLAYKSLERLALQR